MGGWARIAFVYYRAKVGGWFALRALFDPPRRQRRAAPSPRRGGSLAELGLGRAGDGVA